ncbi:MAG: hypothetical protein ACR2G7_10235 [Acidimicrobiales bacterium]
MRGSVQERVETSLFGQWVLSALLVFTIAAVAIWNLPESGLKRAGVAVVEPYANATGLAQSWNVFAPDPPRLTMEIYARVRYADGTSELWRPPKGDAVIGHYRTYRWWKWVESARIDDNQFLWEPTAAWAAAHVDGQGRQPEQVELVRRWRDLAPPGSSQPDGDWQEFTYFILKYDQAGAS